MIEFGAGLRLAREAKGMTLKDIARETHIMVQMLEGLENEDFSCIVAPIYGRGFVKLYCECVGLDPAPYIDAFLDIYNGVRPPAPRPAGPAPAPASAPALEEVPASSSGPDCEIPTPAAPASAPAEDAAVPAEPPPPSPGPAPAPVPDSAPAAAQPLGDGFKLEQDSAGIRFANSFPDYRSDYNISRSSSGRFRDSGFYVRICLLALAAIVL